MIVKQVVSIDGNARAPLNLISKDFPVSSTCIWDFCFVGMFRASVKDRLRNSNRPLVSVSSLGPACKPRARSSIVRQCFPLKG
jgi:hypothetical protein